MADKIVLYRVEGSWLTDASIGPSKGLSICSGDASAEWYVNVAPDHLPALLGALRRRKGGERAPAATQSADPGTLDLEEIMSLLLELFGNQDSNPFSDIEDFLRQSGVPWKGDFWGSM